MPSKIRSRSRRTFLKSIGVGAGAAALGGLTPFEQAQAAGSGDRTRFLIVMAAGGGASIIDGPMAIEHDGSRAHDELNTFKRAEITTYPGSELRAIDRSAGRVGAIPFPYSVKQSDFLAAHRDQMLVSTVEGTSVNHNIGQRRSVTGNEAWAGRTMQEIVALEYGQDFALPNVHLALGGGYTERGTDDTLPSSCYGEPVSAPLLWPLALDGRKGLPAKVSDEQLEKARGLRDQLEAQSRFGKVFDRSQRLAHWRHLRQEPQRAIEAQDLINKLLILKESPQFPLSALGLKPSALAEEARQEFPNYLKDPFEAQAMMAYLLIVNRVSVTVTIGPSFDPVISDNPLQGNGLINPPIAFDFSHQAHRDTQAVMWARMYGIASRLIKLLKRAEYASGQSFWDRSMIYVATEFGRTKTCAPNAQDNFSSGHHLNNGVLLVSPLVKGNTILGGVHTKTEGGFRAAHTYGYNPMTGVAQKDRVMAEGEVFSGILDALGVDTKKGNLPLVRAMKNPNVTF